METIKYVKLKCQRIGRVVYQHWGDPSKVKEGDSCKKCAYFAKQHAEDSRNGLLQHNGTPWSHVLGDPLPKPVLDIFAHSDIVRNERRQ